MIPFLNLIAINTFSMKFIFVLSFIFITNFIFSFDQLEEGYSDKTSYKSVDTIKFYLSSAEKNQRWFYILNINHKIIDSVYLTVDHQEKNEFQPWVNYGYKAYSTYLPIHLHTGIYSLENKVFFIIKNDDKNAQITIVYPTNTENAYNNSGGKSLYNFNSTAKTKANTVTFLRPLSPFIINEVRLACTEFLKWVSHKKEFTFQYISDQDMEDYTEISSSQLIVIIGHSEYWSRKARENFDKFVNLGNDAVVLSGNTMGWQVRIEDDLLVCYKDAKEDPIEDKALKTIEWANGDLNYSTVSSIGCDWPHGAYGMHKNHGNYGYTIINPHSPLLENTGLKFFDFVSCQSYEYDGTLINGTDENGIPIIDVEKLNFYNIELIGYDKADPVDHYNKHSGYGTFIVFQKMVNSGIIVNTAFNTFTGKTPNSGTGGISGKDSVVIRKIVDNIFDKLIYNKQVFTRVAEFKTLQENKIDVFPNPTSRFITLTRNNNDLKILILKNQLGEIVLSTTLNFSNQMIDLSQLKSGVYNVFLDDNYTTKVVLLD